MRLQRRGFTLIELMVVVAIIGMLAAVVVVNVAGRKHPADVAAVKMAMQGMESAINNYKLDNGVYPRELQDLWVRPAGARRWGPDPYVTRYPPKDPWGNAYVYERKGRGFEITSYGADGAPGGTGEAQDLPFSKLVVEGWDPVQNM